MTNLEMELRELARRLQNVLALVASGGKIDTQLVSKLDEISIRCDTQYRDTKTVDPADLELMNDLISLIELTVE